MPRTERAVVGGLSFTSADFCDFRIHGPRMRIDDLFAPSEIFVARVSASIATVDRFPGRGWISLQPTTLSLRFLPYPPRSAGAPQKPRLPRRPSPSRLLFKEFHTGGRLRRDHGHDRVRLAWLSGAPDGEAVFGPHVHFDAPTYSNSSWQCTPFCRLWLWFRRGPSTIYQAC